MELDQNEVRRLFTYKETGDLINNTHRKRGSVGTIVIGYREKDGYIRTSLNYQKFIVHRLIWVYHYGAIPKGMQIDHINRDRHDNRIENLRLADRSLQMRNRSMHKNNISGVTGVTYKNRDKFWVANIGHRGEVVHLGSFKTKDEAILRRKRGEIEYGYPNAA
jgi:HNH endonuclease